MSSSDVRVQTGWMPAGQDDLEEWLAALAQQVKMRGEQITLHPVIVEFQELLKQDPLMRMTLNEMIAQTPLKKPYSRRHLENVDQMLRLINEVLTMAPEFSEDSTVMTPLGAILDWTMGTQAGFGAYRDPRMNAILCKVLNAWGEFLSSPDSRYVLNDTPAGWKSDAAQQAVGMEQFEYDPDDEYWGFASWNDFFTRHFKDGERTVAAPKDDNVIVSACESKPYKISTDVQLESPFWIKGQPYSLRDMLAGDESAEGFVGGTVYQAFLSATNYHRWHAPVAGKIVRAFVQPGTYYSEADSEGEDAIEPSNSQGYMAHVATRAIIIIDADNPTIGEVAVVLVGMSDVSSCIIDEKVKAGFHVDKGDELGFFQFGGSTECLTFRAGVIDRFAVDAIPQPDNPEAPLVLVRSELATVTRTSRKAS